MRISLDWLREWVDVGPDANKLACQLTTAGLEVEALFEAAPPFNGVIVGQIVSVEKHAKADQLKVCGIDDGESVRLVVCGAPNVEPGLKVAFAPVNSVLASGACVEKTQLRGIWSEGMLCSAKELGLGEDDESLLAFGFDAPTGVSLKQHLKLEDTILDIDLTPNRGDCFSVLGIAREASAIYGLSMKPNPVRPVAEVIADQFPVSLKADAACPSFFGRVIRNIKVDVSSPLWMKERLRRAGMRSIHPVVDVTNYVMLEFGQPLHAYDLNQLRHGIVVRFATKDERLTLLDGRELDLNPDVLVIADTEGVIAIAGVMGGERTAVAAKTTDIFLEAAFFAPGTVAGRARRYGLQTDASLRFERGVDSRQQRRAIERATALLLEITGGEPGPSTVTIDEDALPKKISIDLQKMRLEMLLGVQISKKQVEGILNGLQMEFESSDEGWRVWPPSFRFDLHIEEDLVEEIARLVGYEKIPSSPTANVADHSPSMVTEINVDCVADLMVAKGYTEVINYAFVEEDLERAINPDNAPVYLENPISQEMKVMRRSLWPGLLRTAQQNFSRQQGRLKIFEIGGQFMLKKEQVTELQVVAGLAAGSVLPEHWDIKIREMDFFDVNLSLDLELNG